MPIKLINEVDFKPLDKFVVTFNEFRTFKAPQSVVDKAASTTEETVTKIVKKPVKYNHQVAVVVSTPFTEEDGVKNQIIAGDKVLVDFRACMPLDGYDNLYMIPKYNIMGVIN